MPKTMPKQWHAKLVNALAMTTPAVRMVLIETYSYKNDNGEDEQSHEVYPVLAIALQDIASYTKTVQEHTSRNGGATHEDMNEKGWTFDQDRSGTEFDVVIQDHEFGLSLAKEDGRLAGNALHETVVCPWPPEEDEARLAPIIERLRAECAKKFSDPNP